MGEMKQHTLFGAGEAARILGLKYRTLDHWVRTGLLPVEQPAAGTGNRRGLSFLDLVRAMTVKRLRQEGVSLQAIRRVIEVLSEHYHVDDPLTQDGRLLLAGDRVWWAVDDRTVIDILKGQLGMKPLVILEVGEVVEDVRRGLREVCAA